MKFKKSVVAVTVAPEWAEVHFTVVGSTRYEWTDTVIHKDVTVSRSSTIITQTIAGMGRGDFNRGRHRFCFKSSRLAKRVQELKRQRCRSVRRQARIALHVGRYDALPGYVGDGWVLY